MKKKKLKEKKTGHHSSSSLGAERVVVLMSAVMMVGAVGCVEMVVAIVTGREGTGIETLPHSLSGCWCDVVVGVRSCL